MADQDLIAYLRTNQYEGCQRLPRVCYQCVRLVIGLGCCVVGLLVSSRGLLYHWAWRMSAETGWKSSSIVWRTPEFLFSVHIFLHWEREWDHIPHRRGGAPDGGRERVGAANTMQVWLPYGEAICQQCIVPIRYCSGLPRLPYNWVPLSTFKFLKTIYSQPYLHHRLRHSGDRIILLDRQNWSQSGMAKCDLAKFEQPAITFCLLVK